MAVESKPDCDIMQVPYYRKKGDGQPALRMQLHRKSYACPCAIYERATPEYLVNLDGLTFHISRSNFAKLVSDNGDQMSTTNSRL